jgi:DNA-binding NarL/FixJ family response regulator
VDDRVGIHRVRYPFTSDVEEWSAMIKVLLADDHAVVRDGLRVLLEAQSDISVVGDVANGREAVRFVLQQHPDVVVLDIAMPELNGIEATQQIHDASPSTQVLILSMHSTTEHIFRALQAGARGYLLKESAGTEVLDNLSPRERQILQLVVEGKSSAEAAAMLFLSPKTVDTYRSRMMQKLGIGDLASLVKFAIQHGVTQLD